MVSAVVAALHDQLRQRETLANLGVNVVRFPQKPETYGQNYLLLFAAGEGALEYGTYGRAIHDERATLTGVLEARAPGAGDDVSQAASDTALAMLAELEQQLIDDTQVNGTCSTALLVAYRHTTGLADDSNRYHRIEFDIEITAQLGR